jgi:hypothetical protein
MTQGNQISFPAAKKRTEYFDISDFFIWDTSRDNDGGAWRESYRRSIEIMNEGTRSYVRTEMPSTIVLLARAGVVEIHDFTNALVAKYSENSTLIETLSGPIPVDAVCKVSAAEGVIAVSAGTDLFLFDMVTRQIFMFDETGAYIVKGPPMVVGTWTGFDTIQIGTGHSGGLTTFGAVTTSRAVGLYGERSPGRGVRPFVFVEAEDRIIGIRPDLTIIEFTNTGWGYVDSLKCLPDGTLTFRGGTNSANASGYVFRPSSWYYSLGSSQAATHAAFASLVGSSVTTGNDEIGFENTANGRLLVRDIYSEMGGCRMFHDKGFSTKVPGQLKSAILAIDTPATNVLPGGANAVITGTLTRTNVRGFNFFSGWATGNWIEATEVVADWNGSWAISMLVSGAVNAGLEYIAEFGHAPAGYTGSAARLITDAGIIKFQTTNDGWATTDTEIVFGEMSEKPVAIMCGVYAAQATSMSFAAVDGIIKFDKGTAAPVYNASAKLSIGRSRAGADPCDSHSISNVATGTGFGYSAVMKCFYENLEMVSQMYSATELHGTRHYLVGGDDEFGVYGVLTNTNLSMFKDGLLTSVALSELGFNGTTLKKSDMRGWRVGIMFEDNTLLDNGIWLSPGSLSFSRSDFESIITGPPKGERKFGFDLLLQNSADHIGPLLPVAPGDSAIFKISARRRDLSSGETKLIEGHVTVQRDNTGASLGTLIESFGGATELDIEAHAQGAYLELVAAPANGKQEWHVEIIRL